MRMGLEVRFEVDEPLREPVASNLANDSLAQAVSMKKCIVRDCAPFPPSLKANIDCIVAGVSECIQMLHHGTCKDGEANNRQPDPVSLPRLIALQLPDMKSGQGEGEGDPEHAVRGP